MPLALARARVEADERLGEQVGAKPPAAPVVAARRAGRDVQQPALRVERHQTPDVGVAGETPGTVLPRVGAERVVRLRHRVEDPAPFARVDVEGLDRSRRVEPFLDAVRHAAPDDDEVVEDNRRRRLVEHLVRHRVREILGQQHLAVIAEGRDRRAVGRVERIQAVAAVDEDAHVAARAPHRDAPVLEAARGPAVRPGAPRLGVERPELLAGLGVQRDDPRVHRRHVDDVVDHQRHRLEAAGARPELLVGQLVRLPRPGDLELLDVRGVDVGDRRVLGRRLLGADEGPLDHLAAALLGARRRNHPDYGTDEKRNCAELHCVLLAARGKSPAAFDPRRILRFPVEFCHFTLKPADPRGHLRIDAASRCAMLNSAVSR